MNHVIRAVTWKAAQAGIVTGVAFGDRPDFGDRGPPVHRPEQSFLTTNLNGPHGVPPA